MNSRGHEFPTEDAQWLTPLADAHDAERHGGKAAGLARILAIDLPVPVGWVVSPAAMHDAIRRASLEPLLDRLRIGHGGPDEGDCNAARAALIGALQAQPLDPALRQELASITADGGKFAVRSSAVGEDGSEHSFAGQLDSVLGVVGIDAVEAAVRQVWGSLWSARSLAYQRRTGIELASAAVIIQRQIDAVRSGVLFTQSPVNPSQCLIEYCQGLGEGLVSGALDPARATFDRDTRSLRSSEAGEDGGKISEASLRTLLDQALQLEAQFGRALDIEWAIDRCGKIWMLQARPITTVQQPDRAAVSQRFSNANIAENYPEPITPMLHSIVGPAYSAYFRNLGLGFGISRRRVEAMEPALGGVVGVHAGRLYYNLSNIHALIRLAPGGRELARYFNEFIGASDFPQPVNSIPDPGYLGRALEWVRVATCVARQYLGVTRRIARFERRIDEYCDRYRPETIDRLDRSQLLTALRGFTEIRMRQWNDAALADTAAMVCYGSLGHFLQSALPPDARLRPHNNLLVGLPDLASQVPVQKLWALSRQILDDPELTALFDGPPEAVLPTLRQTHRFKRFDEDFRSYLTRWGFRSSGELMLSQPSPEEDPLPTLALLRSYVQLRGASPDQRLARQAIEREEATAQIRARLDSGRGLRLPVWVARRIFDRLLSATQASIRLRERARMKQARLYVTLRHVLMACGRRLHREGRIDVAEHVLFLRLDELESHLAGLALQPDGLAGLVALREPAHRAFAAMHPPDRFTVPVGEYLGAQAGPTKAPPGAAPSRALTGIGACGGRVDGPAAVLGDATEGGSMAEPSIVVTRQTDPGWASVFFLAKGLVVERGGMLSHGAIIAREFGIPAVVGVRDATTQIRSGQHLSVDGDRGEVRLVD
ncbi:MAG: hypothetical protein KDG52_00925 [Rhodocyclaceae bacterium]|nr:hypothetical protein [Rhodocyclaceae bacterium]